MDGPAVRDDGWHHPMHQPIGAQPPSDSTRMAPTQGRRRPARPSCCRCRLRRTMPVDKHRRDGIMRERPRFLKRGLYAAREPLGSGLG
jgi:hypothetical protein